MFTIKQYVKAASLAEAYELNQKKSNLILGGMHWMKMTRRPIHTAIDLSGLSLDTIVETEDAFEIGAMVSLRQLECHEGLNAYTKGAVAEALKNIVGVQFRNTATVGGSIFGRYGFSDVLTVFLAMDTSVVLFQAGELPLKQFASMKADRDILTKLMIRKKPLKIAYTAMRHQRTDFPILTCCVSSLDGSWRSVVGARPSRAQICPDETGILNCGITEESAKAFGEKVASTLTFGSNLRGSAAYRQQLAAVLTKRAALLAAKEDV